MTTTERISVIVPTRNNERTLEQCLRSVRDQTHPDVELIVVDNFSTDATVAIAETLADQVLQHGPERSAQRNAGIEAATGEWVLWLDSDIYLAPTSLASCLEVARVEGVDAVALPERTIGSGFWTKVRSHERECYMWERDLHNPRLLRRDFMTSGGAFDTRMSGPEDADLRLRLRAAGHSVGISPVIIWHDEGHQTLATIFEKRVYYGQSLPTLTEEHPTAVGDHFRALIGVYVRQWRILLRHPLLTAALVPMRLMEAVGYLVGSRRRTPA